MKKWQIMSGTMTIGVYSANTADEAIDAAVTSGALVAGTWNGFTVVGGFRVILH